MKKKLVLIIFIALGMGFILYQGTRDLDTSLSISDQIVNRFLAFVLNDPTLSSDAYFQYYPTVNYYVRKLAHFLEYAAIGSLLAYFFRKTKSSKMDVFVYSLFCVALIALSDEYLQRLIGRGSLVSDVWIDFWGGMAGVICLLTLRRCKYGISNFLNQTRKKTEN